MFDPSINLKDELEIQDEKNENSSDTSELDSDTVSLEDT